MDDDRELIPVRFPRELIRRADALIPVLQNRPEVSIFVGRITRTAVLRIAAFRGLEAMEAEYGPSGGDD